MNGRGPESISESRLAELVDGALPVTDGERAMVELMAQTRDLEEGAGEALRARVREQVAAGPVAGGGSVRLREWLGGLAAGPAWRRVAAPIAAVVLIGAAVAIPSVTGGGGGDDGPSAGREDAPLAADATRMRAAPEASAANPDAAGAAEATAPPVADLPAPSSAPSSPKTDRGPALRLEVADAAAQRTAVTEATAAVRAAGGERVAARVSGQGRVLTFAVPADRGVAVREALERLGAVEPEQLRAATPETGADQGAVPEVIRLVVAVAPPS